MLAYSAIGQVGYVLVAIGVGGPVGFAAAILYTVVNALNKTLLFLTAQDARRARRRRVRARRAQRRRRAAGGRVRRQARAVPAVADRPILLVLLFLGSALSFVYVFQVYQFDFWRTERTGDAAAGRSR